MPILWKCTKMLCLNKRKVIKLEIWKWVFSLLSEEKRVKYTQLWLESSKTLTWYLTQWNCQILEDHASRVKVYQIWLWTPNPMNLLGPKKGLWHRVKLSTTFFFGRTGRVVKNVIPFYWKTYYKMRYIYLVVHKFWSKVTNTFLRL